MNKNAAERAIRRIFDRHAVTIERLHVWEDIGGHTRVNLDTHGIPNLLVWIDLRDELDVSLANVESSISTSSGCPTCGYGEETTVDWSFRVGT